MQILTLNVWNSSQNLLYSAYVMLMTLSSFKKRKASIELLNIFAIFPFFGLKNDTEKCEIAGIAVKKGVKVAFAKWNVLI